MSLAGDHAALTAAYLLSTGVSLLLTVAFVVVAVLFVWSKQRVSALLLIARAVLSLTNLMLGFVLPFFMSSLGVTRYLQLAPLVHIAHTLIGLFSSSALLVAVVLLSLSRPKQ